MDKDKEERRGQIIGRVLPGAVRLWLQAQVEQVDSLAIDLRGRDRQLISGYIPGVSISAENAVYKGLQLSEVKLAAEDIRINLGQVVRGKPLRLMKQFPVKGRVLLSDADVATSVSSPLLAEGLADFWGVLVQLPAFAQAVEQRYGVRSLQSDTELHRPLIELGDGCLALSFYPYSQGQTDEGPIILGARLSVVSDHYLQLSSPHWLNSMAMLPDITQGEPIDSLSDFRWNLGEDTQLTQLDLQPTQLTCEGQVMVRP
ncbi:DUF2993 domain-containing protein [cf. Phormidesmis sp. LEGE 11477]|uniref:LmeA family phospholipid-binding protein n=1 Tax=cf. Phormidesmis sp. LEGE 11477 TaxID=1828680 RepID=UPI00187E9810|nr:DUF2993 domain-containing protein [cf. Phormidesmis sp. LEGE 11477]MBE9064814.1 DUF2993 domain-containing protein [cf. Phormidesmis sp. LEGE 11477]